MGNPRLERFAVRVGEGFGCAVGRYQRNVPKPVRGIVASFARGAVTELVSGKVGIAIGAGRLGKMTVGGTKDAIKHLLSRKNK